jgi:2',3'-cyclic-nucleotide 2'-phosphodiesterase (5'-nucleotidase family)
LIDSGDLFFAPSYRANAIPKKEILDLKIDLYFKTYELMGYDAFIPGEIDLFWGVPYLLQKRGQTGIPFLLANLEEARSGKTVFQPYLIKNFQGVQVGLFGLLAEDLSLGNKGEEGKFRLTEPIPAAQKVVKELKNKNCTVIIAVAHMDLEGQRNLARAVPEINIILAGHFPEDFAMPIRPENSNSQILLAGARGEHLGQLDIFPGGDKLNSRYKLIRLSEEYPDHASVSGPLNRYKEKFKALFSTPGKAQEDARKVSGQVSADGQSSFVGEAACLTCHTREHAVWKKTGHALAYQTLVRQDRSSDHTCLPCHTTGIGAASIFTRVMENVQCESCHGPRKGHPENGKKFPLVSEKECLSCHNPAKSPNFNYVPYVERVRCAVAK